MAKTFENKHKYPSYVICDFETGGTDMKRCALTEIALLAIDGATLQEIDRYEAIIKPYKLKGKDVEYDDAAIKVTGLSPDICERDGKDMLNVVTDVHDFLTKVNLFNSKTGYKPVYVAHNAQFELKCWQQMEAMGLNISKLFAGDEDFHGNFIPHFIDTMDLAKLTWNANIRQTSYKLGEVLAKAGIPIYDAHRAMNDVKPTTEFLQMIANMLRNADRASMISNSNVNEDGKKEKSSRLRFQFN